MPSYYEQQAPPPGFQDTAVIRSVWRCLLLNVVSFGFWGFAWIYHTTKEVSSKVNNPAPSPAFRTVMYAIPIANIVVWFLCWKDIEEYCKRARSQDFPMVLFFLLTILLSLPGLVTLPIVQSRMNEAHMAATNGAARPARMQTIDWVFVIVGAAFWIGMILLFVLAVILAASSSTA